MSYLRPRVSLSRRQKKSRVIMKTHLEDQGTQQRALNESRESCRRFVVVLGANHCCAVTFSSCCSQRRACQAWAQL